MEPSTTIPKSIAPKLIRLAETPKIRISIKAKSMASPTTTPASCFASGGANR